MPQISYPFENVDVSEVQFGLWASNFQQYGVKGIPGDSNLLVSGDNSGMQVRVAAGEAFIRGHYYQSTGQETVLITPANASLPRIDSIVLELDITANNILLKAIAGTANASPVAPTLTQTTNGIYQLRLANVAVGAAQTSIVAGNVTDLRTFMGQQVGVWTTATRPANPVANSTIGYNVTLGFHEYWTGSAWSSLVPDQSSPFLLMGA